MFGQISIACIFYLCFFDVTTLEIHLARSKGRGNVVWLLRQVKDIFLGRNINTYLHGQGIRNDKSPPTFFYFKCHKKDPGFRIYVFVVEISLWLVKLKKRVLGYLEQKSVSYFE